MGSAVHVRCGVAIFVAAVIVLGCTPSNSPEVTDDRPSPIEPDPPTAKQEPTAPPPAEPQWTQVELPPEAQLSVPRAAFTGGALAGTDRLPHMVAGVTAEPGEPDHVRVWTSNDGTDLEPNAVTLRSKAHASVTDSTTDGTTTALVGTTWTLDDGFAPYAVTSGDRRTWNEVTLPAAALDRAVQPHRVAVDATGGLVMVGVDHDQLPVAVLAAGERDQVIDLPAPEGTLAVENFGGIVVDGDTVLVLAQVAEPGEGSHPVAYRSADGGLTWELGDGPTEKVAGVQGMVRTGNAFVATGWKVDDGFPSPAAWSSPDGLRWTEEDVPRHGDSSGAMWAPEARGDQVVAAYDDGRQLWGVVVRRDRSGRWSVVGTTRRWIGRGALTAVAPLADGSVLTAMWVRNSGIVGVVSNEGKWRAILGTMGPDDEGLKWIQSAVDGDTPVLLGQSSRLTLIENGWVEDQEARRLAFVDDATISEDRWDPPASKDWITPTIVSDESGATAVLGVRINLEPGQPAPNQAALVDGTDVVGWFRPAPDARWTRAEGLEGPRAEGLRGAVWLGDRWVAAGTDRDTTHVNVHERAAVWMSTDGRRWRRQKGPFEIASDRDSWASGACKLPGSGGVLVVGAAQSEGPRSIDMMPTVWRMTGDRWTRIDREAVGRGLGWILSCATRGDVTVLQGRYRNRSTVWQTTDGKTFEAHALGEPGDAFGTVRPLAHGFVAAGTRSFGSTSSAVVWLSTDGEHWKAVPVPSDRPLFGWDVRDWNGRLVVAANSVSDPEVWILENPDELLNS